MRAGFEIVAIVTGLVLTLSSGAVTAHASGKHWVVTNDDAAGPNTISFYQADKTRKLVRVKSLTTGGTGSGGGYFGIVRQVLADVGSEECAFAADGGSNDIAAVLFDNQSLVGNFKGSITDTDGPGGMGLAVNPTANYLYAAFSGSSTIATFTISQGCSLTFVNDVAAGGVNGGFPHGMAISGNMLVVAYGDGSIGSFNIASGTPVPNGDLQLSTGYVNDGVFPDGLDVSSDGHYAIFGDASRGFSEVEVSDISSGILTTTVTYGGSSAGLGDGLAANNVRLSPDESLLYISDNLSGQVTAANFDNTTGTLTFGCISKVLRGFETKWAYSSAVTTENLSGDGTTLWVAEDAKGLGPSSIGIVTVRSARGNCILRESKDSPVSDPESQNLSWLNASPQRAF